MRSEDHLVSIITPTYNHENYIACCIESVRSQHYQYWEMIIVNDGSSDATLRICESYAQLDDRITILDQKNVGIFRLNETYNAALRAARGKYVAILEGDDWWPSDKLTIQIGYHESNPHLVMSHGKVMQSDGATLNGEYPRPPITGQISTVEYLRLLLLKESCLMPVSVVIRKSVLDAIGGFKSFPGFPAVDLPTFRDVLLEEGDVVWIDHVLGFWRQSTTQATNTVFTPKIDRITQSIILTTYERLKPAKKKAVKLSRRQIIRSTQQKIIIPGLMASLRKSLKSGERSRSISLSAQIFYGGNAKNRVFALLGLIASILSMNIEFLYQKKGRR